MVPPSPTQRQRTMSVSRERLSAFRRRFMSLAKLSQSLCLALICAGIYSTEASAHIGTADDFECSDSYRKDCWVMGNSNRVLRMWFKGSESEMGTHCQTQTQKLQSQIQLSLQSLSLPNDRIGISAPQIEFASRSGRPAEYRCEYVIWSKQQDLRFSVRYHNRRFWTDDRDLHGICRDDLRAAEAKPGSIGAGISRSGSLLQGIMCTTHYLIPGLDRMKTFASGTTQLIKFGSSADERDRAGLLVDPSVQSASGPQN